MIEPGMRAVIAGTVIASLLGGAGSWIAVQQTALGVQKDQITADDKAVGILSAHFEDLEKQVDRIAVEVEPLSALVATVGSNERRLFQLEHPASGGAPGRGAAGASPR